MMRATWNMLSRSLAFALQHHLQRLAEQQEMLATGKRLNRPSQAPEDSPYLLMLRSADRARQSRLRNLDVVDANLSYAASLAQEMSAMLANAKQILVQGASDTSSPEIRQALAEDIDKILEQFLSLANSHLTRKHLFGGRNVEQSPYIAESVNGRIAAVRYVGSDSANQAEVASGIFENITAIGNELFGSGDRQEPVFMGDTGAVPGAGTSNVTGEVVLEVVHTSTTYLGGSGLAPGTSSPAGDAILGPAGAHVVAVDQPGGTLQLDGGSPVSFTGGETDLRLINEAGDVAYVDVTALAPGFVGTVQAQTTGTLSIDGGASTGPIDYSTGQAVTDSASGQLLWVDSSAITRVGVESVRAPGTYDVFSALIAARDALANVRELPTREHQQHITVQIDAIEEVSECVRRALTRLGATLTGLESLKQTMGRVRALDQAQISEVEDADITEVVTELARWQTLYQTALAAGARILSVSLLDFLE
jgi:flagellin-like hook-associated protein FlgL